MVNLIDCHVELTETDRFVRHVKHIINWIVWGLMALYLLLFGVTQLPLCQRYLGQQIAKAVGETLGTEASIGRVDIGLFNRVIIDDVHILDQQKKEMLRVARLSVTIDLLPLTKGKISIMSAQVFGAHASLYQNHPQAKPNFQFVIDSLASDDTKSPSKLDLRMNTFIMRHSSISYDVLSEAATPNLFNPRHLKVEDISVHLMLKALTDDSLNLNIKRLGLREQSGLLIDNLALRLEANKQRTFLRNFILEMPSSHVEIDSANATYLFRNDTLSESSIAYHGAIKNTHITPSDLRCFHSALKNFQRSIRIETAFNGTWQSLDVPLLSITSDAGDIKVSASGHIDGLQTRTPAWNLNVAQLSVNDNITDFIHKNIVQLPPQLKSIGSLQLNGQFAGNKDGGIAAKSFLQSDLGDIDIDFLMTGTRHFSGTLKTPRLALRQLVGDEQLGTIVGDLQFDGQFHPNAKPDVHLKGTIPSIDYKNYTFSNIQLDGTYTRAGIAGQLQIDDPNVKASLKGQMTTDEKGLQPATLNIDGDIGHIAPHALHLPSQWQNVVFSGKLEADFTAHTINDAIGTLRISQFAMNEPEIGTFRIDNLLVNTGFEDGLHFVTLVSDFAKADLKGHFEYATLAHSITNVIGSKLPTMPGLPPLSEKARNNFLLRLNIFKSDWLKRLFNIDLDILQPITLTARVNDHNRTFFLDSDLPRFLYNGALYTDGAIHIDSPVDTLRCDVQLNRHTGSTNMLLGLKANASDNHLTTSLSWDNRKSAGGMSGELNAITELYRNLNAKPEAHVRIQPSHIVLNDTIWNVEPADIIYSENNLLVDHFNVHHRQQHITVDGRASRHAHDSLTVDLNQVEVAYILNLVNFHTVEFSGLATGRAVARSLFSDFSASTHLRVDHFKFENGRMGVLHADASWNREREQIDIHAVADDGPGATTLIDGYVSPTHNTIDLAFGARGTYIDFMHNFTNSFLSYITGHADGDLRLAGTLDNINLTGSLVVEGDAKVTALNTAYHLHRDTVVFIPDEIELHALPLTDVYGNHAALSGGVHHQHLTNLTFDLFVDADNLLAYDFQDFGDSNFYGTVFATGDVSIKGRPGEVTIDCNVTPQKNTVFVYNASSPDAISSQEFIQWGSVTKQGHPYSTTPYSSTPYSTTPQDIPTDIYINFLINCTPDATMRLLMDANTNDYITLNGDGTIRATFYNKGPFNMFGTYTVDHGTYGVTIQNIIKKNFTFNRGGTIVFGGNPYNAALNLQAQHTVSGVSLSDLNIGNSFASNTIRVNCLMNIAGQPNSPQVDFDLEMPTVNADEQQMVRSVINGQQEMNQQVLYLLAIGRFYTQGQNNANTQQDQTSLAMQSFLSGTLSSQLNTLLGTVIKNDNWNFGANISTGNEGWHNAEYEGLISGRMLNNRLLLNGQFGYRDNATRATPSFIGDFDIQYLLHPNGNLALKVYNQTNDRYFTRSSLNTQGIGLIMKKDFNGLGDLLAPKTARQKDKKKRETK